MKNGKTLAKFLSATALFLTMGACTVFGSDLATVSEDRVNIRALNSTDSEVLGQYNKGDSLKVLGYDGEWLQFAHPTKGVAYLNGNFAEFSETDAFISKNNVNIRKEPTTSSEILGKFQAGDQITVMGAGLNWYEIRHNGGKAYVYLDFVTGDYINLVKKLQLVEDSAQSTSNSLYAVVTSSTGLNIRKAPSVEAPILYVMPREDVMDVLERGSEWTKIALDDLVGYVSSEFIDIRRGEKPSRSSYSSKGLEVVAYAKQFLGNPYRWGGTSLTKGADCSGFVLSVMKHFGVTLNRTSRDQAKNGAAVSKSELRAGDLVFFGGKTISHVGIYIGNNQFIHASDSKTGIIISSLSRRSDYVTARRIFK